MDEGGEGLNNSWCVTLWLSRMPAIVRTIIKKLPDIRDGKWVSTPCHNITSAAVWILFLESHTKGCYELSLFRRKDEGSLGVDPDQVKKIISILFSRFPDKGVK